MIYIFKRSLGLVAGALKELLLESSRREEAGGGSSSWLGVREWEVVV